MISRSIHRESAHERRWSVVMALLLVVVGFLMAMYGLAITAGLFAEWFARLY